MKTLANKHLTLWTFALTSLALFMVTLAIKWRTRERRRRGLVPRWGLPRPPRRNFASFAEVRSRLGSHVARTVTKIADPTDRHER